MAKEKCLFGHFCRLQILEDWSSDVLCSSIMLTWKWHHTTVEPSLSHYKPKSFQPLLKLVKKKEKKEKRKRRSWGSGTYVLLLASEVRETDIGAIALQVDGCWVRRASEVPEKIQLPWGRRRMIDVCGENAHACVMITGNTHHINKNGPPALGLNNMSCDNCLYNEICQNGRILVAVMSLQRIFTWICFIALKGNCTHYTVFTGPGVDKCVCEKGLLWLQRMLHAG